MKSFIILILIFGPLRSLNAKDIFLRKKNGKAVKNYDALIREENLRPGDRIYLNSEKYFTYVKNLGEGNLTQVLEVTSEGSDTSYALRLPYRSGFAHLAESEEAINEFIYGYYTLKEQNISIPNIIESKEFQYVLVDKIEDSFNLHSFLFNEASTSLSANQLKEAEKALVEFIKEIAPFESISDAHGKQIVYDIDKKKWILIDWRKRSFLARPEQTYLAISLENTFKVTKKLVENYSLASDIGEYRRARIAKNLLINHKEKLFLIQEKEKKYLEIYLQKDLKNLKADDILDFYKKAFLPPFTTVTEKGVFAHFKKNELAILEKGSKKGDYFSDLGDILIRSTDQLDAFLKATLSRMNSLEELDDFSQSLKKKRRLINLYNESESYRFKKFVSDRVSELLETSSSSKIDKQTLKNLRKDSWILGDADKKLRRLSLRISLDASGHCTKKLEAILKSLVKKKP